MTFWQAGLVIALAVVLFWADQHYLDGAVIYWLGNKMFDWINWLAIWR